MAEEKKPRPYWHVDAKWVFGLIYSFFLSLSLVFFTLSTLLSPKVAIPMATYMVASQFSREGLDATADIDQIKKEFGAAPGQDVTFKLGETEISITSEELETLPPRQLRLKVFRQVVEPIYYQQSSPELMKQYGVLALLNKNTADKFHNFFILSLIPVFIGLIGVVVFSYRLGKLINPALPLIFVSGPPSLLLYLITHTTPPPGDAGPLSFFPDDLKMLVVGELSRVFNLYFIAGVGLLILAIIIKIFLTLTKKKSKE